MNPNNRTHFSNLEDALVRVPYFTKVLEAGSVPITQEDDGTFQFFGSGRKVYEYKTRYDDIQGSETGTSSGLMGGIFSVGSYE